MWLYFCEICYLTNPIQDQMETLIAMKYACKLAVRIPDYKLSMELFEHQGVLNKAINNFTGAIRSFQRMRDVAEECTDREYEMKSYLHLGETLQA